MKPMESGSDLKQDLRMNVVSTGGHCSIRSIMHTRAGVTCLVRPSIPAIEKIAFAHAQRAPTEQGQPHRPIHARALTSSKQIG